MRQYISTRLFGDVFEQERLFEDVEIRRISPRSYRYGEVAGWYSGLAVGFVAGVMFICLAFGIL